MNRTFLVTLLLVLAFLGIADSWYLAQSALDGAQLVCNIASLNGCNVVAQSEYSRVFGIPLAMFGVVFYGLLFVAASIMLTVPTRLLYRSALILGILGALASFYFLYLQLVVIKALCIYCVASLVISVLICGITYWLWKRFAPPAIVVVP